MSKSQNESQLNKNQLRETEVKYFLHLLTDEGMKPDPSKIPEIEWKALIELTAEVILYLTNFVPKF